MRTRLVLTALILAAALALPALTAPARAQSGARKVFQISMRSYAFTPSLITVNRGDTVVLQMVNDDPDRRNHSIAARLFLEIEPKASGQFRTGVGDGRRFYAAEPGQRFELEFVAAQAGTFPFVCGVFDHGARGQAGAINVVATAAAQP
ncbi:MAG TPA: cupredoxin domain-containing protein [bacterium]|nr:cupredoxin domain-containing protein [bacterium]